jgi:methylglyoxal synthase
LFSNKNHTAELFISSAFLLFLIKIYMKGKILETTKTIALIAHDHKKDELINWVKKHKDILSQHKLIATGTTGKLIENHLGVEVKRVMSELGGDQQLGAMIAEGEIDIVIFFWDPMEAQPHDSDVKAFLRLCVVWNTVMAILLPQIL